MLLQMWLDMVRGCYRSILVICRQDSVRVWTFQRQWLTSGFRQATLLTEPDDIMRNNGPGVPPSNQIVVKHSNETYQPFSSMMLPAINFCLYGISMIFPWFSHDFPTFPIFYMGSSSKCPWLMVSLPLLSHHFRDRINRSQGSRNLPSEERSA